MINNFNTSCKFSKFSWYVYLLFASIFFFLFASSFFFFHFHGPRVPLIYIVMLLSLKKYSLSEVTFGCPVNEYNDTDYNVFRFICEIKLFLIVITNR